MHSLITGAAGFVGRSLAREIGRALGPGDLLTLSDLAFAAPGPGVAGVRRFVGSLADAAHVAAATDRPVDRVYHLATLPGRGAEDDFEAGRRANLDAMIALLERLRTTSPGCRLIFASSVAVYGSPVPEQVDDDTRPAPAMSYAAHKLIGEVLVNDYSRRGFVDGVSLRLSGIMARPPGATVNASAFFNDLFHGMRARIPITLPVGPDLTSWLMSRPRCVANLLLAAALPAAALPVRRDWALPALHVRIGDLVDALACRFGADAGTLVSYAPQPAIEAIFRQPPLSAKMAQQLGFAADDDIDALLDAVFGDAPD